MNNIENKILRDYLIVLSIVLSVFASVMSSFMLILSYPEIMNFFGVTLKEFHWRTFLFFSSFAVGLPFFGTAIQKIGAKRQFFWGMSVFLIATLGSALSFEWHVFLFFQISQGLADAMMVSTMPVLIRKFISTDRLGWAFGLQSAILSLSSLLGPSLGNVITFYWGWESIFYLLFCITLCALILSYIILSPLKGEIVKGISLPYINALTLFCCFLSLQWLVSTQDYKQPALLICLTCLLLFVSKESRNRAILIPKEILKNFPFIICVIFIFCIAMVTNLIFFFIPGFLQSYLGFSSINLGWIIAANTLIPIILSTYFGKLSDHSPHLMLIIGILFYLLALFIFSFLYLDLNLWILAALYMMIGFASSLSSPAQMKITISSIPKSLTGPYMGFYYFVQFSTGSVATFVFMMFTSEESSSKTMMPNDFHSMLIFCSIVMVMLLALGIIRTYKGIPRNIIGQL